MMEKKRMAALLAAVLFGMSAIPAGAVNLIDTDAAATDSAEHAELDLYGVRTVTAMLAVMVSTSARTKP